MTPCSECCDEGGDASKTVEVGFRPSRECLSDQGLAGVQPNLDAVVNVRSFSPDFAILHHAWNDASGAQPCGRGDQFDIYLPYAAPIARSSSINWTNKWWTWRVLRLRVWGARTPIVFPKIRQGSDPLHAEGDFGACPDQDPLAVYRRNIRSFVELATLDATRAVLTTQPFQRGLDRETGDHVTACNRAMAEIAGELGHSVLFVDLDAAVMEIPEEHAALFLDFGHMNERGRQFEGRILGQAILHDLGETEGGGDRDRAADYQ